jgi:hypothetical protein
MVCPHCLFEVHFSPDCAACGLPAPLRERSGEALCYACHEARHGSSQMYENDPKTCPHCLMPLEVPSVVPNVGS